MRITNDEVFENEDIIQKLIEIVTPSLKERGQGGEEHKPDIHNISTRVGEVHIEQKKIL